MLESRSRGNGFIGLPPSESVHASRESSSQQWPERRFRVKPKAEALQRLWLLSFVGKAKEHLAEEAQHPTRAVLAQHAQPWLTKPRFTQFDFRIHSAKAGDMAGFAQHVWLNCAWQVFDQRGNGDSENHK